jgi:hypothetical protein
MHAGSYRDDPIPVWCRVALRPSGARAFLIVFSLAVSACSVGPVSPSPTLTVCIAMDEIHQARSEIGEALSKAQIGDTAGAAEAGKRAYVLAESALARSVPAATPDVQPLVSVITGVTIDLRSSASIFMDSTITAAEMVSLGRESNVALDEIIAIADRVAVHGQGGSPAVCPNLVAPS